MLEDVEEAALELKLDDRAALTTKLLRHLEGLSENERPKGIFRTLAVWIVRRSPDLRSSAKANNAALHQP
jgi:hypothetical protein